MRRASHAAAVIAFALVMSFGVAAASCARPVTEPVRLRSAVVVQEAVRRPTAHEVAVYVTAVHKARVRAAKHAALVHRAKMRAAYRAWLLGLAAQHAAATHPVPVTSAPAPPVNQPMPVATGGTTIGEGVPCDGPHVPCWRVQIESGGTWNAYNPTGCSGLACYGPYQFSGEWAGKLGLPSDLSTTTHEQWVAAGDALWANGAGCGNWDAC